VTVDVPTLWRPARKRWPRKHERPAANRALPAVIVGISGEGGELNGQRGGLPRAFERVHSKDASAKGLWQRMRTNVQTGLQEDAMAVVDAGVNISALHEAGIERSRIRPATNFTARRNGLPDHRCGRKAKYGTLVRPLARRYNGTTLAATPPDETSAWEEDRRQLRAEIWRTLGVNGGRLTRRTGFLTGTPSPTRRSNSPGCWRRQSPSSRKVCGQSTKTAGRRSASRGAPGEWSAPAVGLFTTRNGSGACPNWRSWLAPF